MSLNRLSRFTMDFEYFQDRDTLIKTALGDSGRGYGYNTLDINAYKDVVMYLNQKSLLEFIEKFEDFLSKIDMGGAFNKQRLKLTSDERGVFSFGSASSGLYLPQEFYSVLLENELPNEFPDYPSGIVPRNFVEKESVLKFSQEDEYIYFYVSPTNNKTYQLIKQDEGTREIELGLRENKVFRTSQKKCYVILPKKSGKAKMVDLYIPKNGGITLKKMLPTFMIAHFLRLYGVMTRINILRTFDVSMGYTGFAFKVKDFGDDLDFNRLALEGADGRTWNLVENCVGNIKSARYRGLKVGNPQLYNTPNNGTSGSYPSYHMMEFMARFRNFYMEKMERGEIDSIRIDKKLMLMGHVEVSDDDTEKMQWEKIQNKFYEILDVVDTQFNKIEEAVKRIYKREVEDMKRRNVSEFKDYMIGVFNLSYSYPLGGSYPESPESIEKMDAEYEEKLDALTEFLQYSI